MNEKETRDKVAQIIQTARVQKGMSQEDLGDAIGCKRQTIVRIEQGVFSPNADILYLILKTLDLPLKIGN